jgi:RNase adapter protein RapZ
MQLIIITGLSGSGKSVVLRALEDAGYYCIDNLPSNIIPTLYDSLKDSQSRIAISTDTRSAGLESFPETIELLKSRQINFQILFLESTTQALVKRFSETRRRHPLSKDSMTLAESIELERTLLGPIAALAHHIDTSDLSANTLRGWVKELVSNDHKHITLLFTSFGFKHGIPLDADFVFDVRCLPNPHYDALLRPKTGQDQAVKDFLKQQPAVDAMYQDIQKFVEKWLPLFIQENRSYLTIAIGCTGGQHRSVYLTETLGHYFQEQHHQVLIRHRELEKTV